MEQSKCSKVKWRVALIIFQSYHLAEGSFYAAIIPPAGGFTAGSLHWLLQPREIEQIVHLFKVTLEVTSIIEKFPKVGVGQGPNDLLNPILDNAPQCILLRLLVI